MTVKERFYSYTEYITETGCLIWLGGTFKKGYGMFSPKAKVTKQAHRFAWELENGSIPAGLLVCHKCDTPLCVNVKHLFLGTVRDNSVDMVKKGRNPDQSGEKHGMAKLTKLQVEEIRKEYPKSGLTMKDFGKLYGISPAQVCRIMNNKRWNR